MKITHFSDFFIPNPQLLNLNVLEGQPAPALQGPDLSCRFPMTAAVIGLHGLPALPPGFSSSHSADE